MALAPGTRLGPYEIAGPLGAGGMGEVYQARDTRLDRAVAIKVLPAELSSDPGRRARFEREARTIAALNHPHICTLHDIGQHDGATYLVMEHLAGETLAQRLRKGALPVPQALEIGAQVADALDAAHKQGIVHRDLKPSNVMLTTGSAGRSGVTSAKLLDFGLAKLTAHGERPALATEMSAPTRADPVTAKGTVLGTLPYMAPEQLEGKEADARTDLWALGAILYEMITGARAFAGDSSVSLIGEIMHAEPPALAARQPLTPPALERLVKRCLGKHPDQRWDSAHDVGDELRWIAETSGTTGLGVPTAPSRRRWRTFVAAGLSVIGAATVGWLGWTLGRRSVPAPAPATVRFTVPNVDDAYSESGSAWGYYRQFALSPDGRHLALIVRDQGRSHLAVRALDALTPRVLPNTEGAALPFWSPDGDFVGFFQGGALRKIALTTGGIDTICVTDVHLGATWGSAGDILTAGPEGLWRVPPSGGERQLMAKALTGESWQSFAFPSFLSDGRRFVVTRWTPSSGWWLHAMSLDGGPLRMLVKAYAGQVVGESLVFLQDTGLFRQALDLETLTLRGAPTRLDAGEQSEGALIGFALSPSGTLVYQRRAPTELRWFDRAGRQGEALPLDSTCRSPELSPDGRHVAVECNEPRLSPLEFYASRDIYTFDLVRKTALRLTTEGRNDSDPTWSPDGARIVFASQELTSPRTILYSTNSTGGGAPERLFESPFETYPTSWWPGRALVYMDARTFYERGEDSRVQWGDLYLLDGHSRSQPLATSPYSEMEGQLTPDSKYLLYTSNETGDHEVYVKSLDDAAGKWRVSTGGGFRPRWRPDGGEIFYLTDRTLMSVPVSWTRGFQPGQPTALFKTRTAGPLRLGLRYTYAVAQGGQRFLMYVGEPFSSLTVVVNATGERAQETATTAR